MARATTDKFPAFSLWPSVADEHFFNLSSTDGLYQNRYHLGVSNSFIWHSLDLIDVSGTRIRSVMDYALGHFFTLGFGITDGWQIGLVLPVFSQARFLSPDADIGASPSTLSRTGDLRFTTRFRLLNSHRFRVGLGLEPFVNIPLGGADLVYLGDSSLNGGMKGLVDILLTRRLRLGFNLGAEFREKVVIRNVEFSHRWLSNAGLSFQATRGISLSLEAQADSAFNRFFSDADTAPVEFLGGMKWEMGESGLTLGFGAGTCAVCGVKGSRARGFFDLSYRRMDEIYVYKEKKEERMREVTLGLRKPPLEPYEVYELAQRCPIEEKMYDVDEDDPRCMEFYELRNLAETCPATGEEEKEERCWEIYELRKHDSDKDGVPDFVDRCPTEFGTAEKKGCPQNAFLILNPEEGQILTQLIRFEFGKSTLMPSAFPILNTLAGALHAQPAIQKLSIEGHTDEVGSENANRLLSKKRAKTVYDYLIEQGISEERLVYEGRGEASAMGDNDTEEGRAQNRRVQFIILEVGAL